MFLFNFLRFLNKFKIPSEITLPLLNSQRTDSGTKGQENRTRLRKMLGKAVSHFHDRKVIAIKVNKTSPPTKKNSMTVPQKNPENRICNKKT